MTRLAMEFAHRQIANALSALPGWKVLPPRFNARKGEWSQTAYQSESGERWAAYGVSELDCLEAMAGDLLEMAAGGTPEPY